MRDEGEHVVVVREAHETRAQQQVRAEVERSDELVVHQRERPGETVVGGDRAQVDHAEREVAPWRPHHLEQTIRGQLDHRTQRVVAIDEAAQRGRERARVERAPDPD